MYNMYNGHSSLDIFNNKKTTNKVKVKKTYKTHTKTIEIVRIRCFIVVLFHTVLTITIFFLYLKLHMLNIFSEICLIINCVLCKGVSIQATTRKYLFFNL